MNCPVLSENVLTCKTAILPSTYGSREQSSFSLVKVGREKEMYLL
jgi:hypothetical protein